MQDLRVLLVDDDEEDAELTRRVLSRATRIQCTVTWIDSFERARAAICESSYDVILLDYRLDRRTGLDLLKETGAGENRAPVILLTGQADAELAIVAMAAGVVDFLEKAKLEPQQLERSIRYAIDRKRIEAELKSSHAAHSFLRSTIDALPVHLAIIDPSGRLIAINESWMRFVRQTRTDSDDLRLGSDHLALCASHAGSPDDVQEAAQAIRDVIGGTRADFQLEYAYNPGSGQRWFAMRATPFDSSRPASVVVTHTDVTERKNLETQLFHAQKMEAIGQLAGGVAHDFNNILTAIGGYAELLLPSLDPESSQREDVEQIRSAADRAANLTRQLLAFSRKEVANPRVFDLNAQLSNLENMLSRLIREDVHLVLALGDEPLQVNIDPTQLEQVVINLVVNGRDAMPDGGVLTLQTFALDMTSEHSELGLASGAGKYAALIVNDTGIGMDVETSARIFEPFFTTKEVGKGTGLGLATVFGIVTQAGGFIRVESRPAAGATFKLYFPLAAAPDVEKQPPPAEHSARQSSSARILFVEDERTLRELATRILEPQGYGICVAENGQQALEICGRDSGRFDLALIDVIMPGLGGGALADRLRRLYPEMKIVMMSGYTGDAVINREIAGGPKSFIQKPYTPEELLAAVREVLELSIPAPALLQKLA